MIRNLFYGAASVALSALLIPSASMAGDISTAPFHSIALAGGGHVDVSYGPVQKVTLTAGSTNITRLEVKDGSLKIYACENRCPTHYELKLAIVMPTLKNVAISGGGDIIGHSGFPAQQSVNAAISGGGTIDIRAITVKSANAAVRGGGSILLTPEQKLAAAVMGGGEITYRGHPEVSQSVMGGGQVKAE